MWGVRRMGDEEAYCVNILWQISSYIAASEKVASLAWSTVQGLTTFTLDLHARVHALEDVTVEEVELLALEAVEEVHRDPDGLPGPHEHGVLPAEVRSCPTLPVYREVRELLGAARPAQDPELECLRVHGVHSALLVADLFAKK
jgi:hypothetical protein